MARTMAHVILPFLVAMATAAPLAEEIGTGEQVVNVNGDSNVVDRAKRAKEEVVFGNQQNGARLGAAKKSVPLFLSEQDQQQPLFPQPENQDMAGYMFAEKQQPVIPQEAVVETEPEGQQVVPAAVEGGMVHPQELGEGAQQQQEPAMEESQLVPVIPVVDGGAEPVPEVAVGEMNKIKKQKNSVEPAPKVANENPAAVEEEEASGANANDNSVPAAQFPVLEPEILTPLGSNLPLNSQNADAEEAMQGQEDAQSDDVESFLKELHENNAAAESSGNGENRQEDEAAKEEGSAEAELMQVANQNANNKEGEVLDADSSDYTQNLLKYILLHGDDYGRAPGPVNYGYQYPRSYYLQRRRRSLARRRLHRRNGSGKQLARSKRTKRDLFDDDLYYPTRQEMPQENPQDEERQADMEELIAYLMALYPSLYENQQPPRQDSTYPGYFWYGNGNGNSNGGYPAAEEGYPEYTPEWEEPEYLEVPAGWEPNQVEAPAWEPAFYPEEVEEPDYYPTPGKRQMLSMVPGNRRKRYFYPFAREPYTHWGAFVPSQEKRDYDGAYWRLKKLAMVLADSRQPSSYLDALDDYRKK